MVSIKTPVKTVTEAEQACIDIYKDYTIEEIDSAPIPSSIYNAWFIGKELVRDGE